MIVVFGSGTIAGMGRESVGLERNAVIIKDFILLLPILVINLSARLIMAKFRRIGVIFAILCGLNLTLFVLSFYFKFNWLFNAYYMYFWISHWLLGTPFVIFAGFLFALSKVKFE